ncbi:MAG: DNA/RNA nuclease SfsA [Christensenellaceae bacterium]|nr:DNA/RNA nuclease SfsA [Christensenellaceae bacterium]
MANINKILGLLKGAKLPFSVEEFQIHQHIIKLFNDNDIKFIHEFKIKGNSRIDFFVEDEIGVEVKKGRPNKTNLIKQLTKYSECENICAIIVIVEKSIALPDSINGKNIYSINLNSQWGIAL